MGSIDCIEMCPGDVGLRSWVASSTPNPDVGYLCTTSSESNLIVGVRGGALLFIEPSTWRDGTGASYS